jgi:CO dehydrogenase/acetyl-CoA synthase beta subunit
MYEDVDEALAQWVEAYHVNINISGEMIRQKAAQFLERLHPDAPKFEFSSGWLAKFKQRHQIWSHRRFGKNGAADTEIIKESLPRIRTILYQYALADIYNMDETGLFYCMQADNLLTTRQLEGRKQMKERITIIICCNADEFDKLPLWIIGKSFRPRCFKNINIDNLDCKYHANKNA